jgi:hypothetical protein
MISKSYATSSLVPFTALVIHFNFTLEQYVDEIRSNNKRKYQRKLQRAKEKGENYFSPERLCILLISL